MNGEIEELLEEVEVNITVINNLIYAAGAIMTQTLNKHSKRSKNRRDVKFWKIRMQKQISSWRKKFSIISETEQVLIMESLSRKKMKIFNKYRVTNAREFALMKETLKQKFQAKAQKIRRYKKGKLSINIIRCLKKTLKIFYRKLGMKNIEDREPPSMAQSETY